MLKLVLVYLIIFILNGMFWLIPALNSVKFLGFYLFLLPILFEKNKRLLWIDREFKQKSLFYSVVFSLISTAVTLGLFYLYLSHFYDIELKIDMKWLMLLHIALVAVSEELLFRGYFLEKLRDITSRHPVELSAFYSVFVSSILFALMHVFEGPPKALMVLLPGLFFGVLKWKTNHIAGSCIAHIAFNIFYLSFGNLPF